MFTTGNHSNSRTSLSATMVRKSKDMILSKDATGRGFTEFRIPGNCTDSIAFCISFGSVRISFEAWIPSLKIGAVLCIEDTQKTSPLEVP